MEKTIKSYSNVNIIRETLEEFKLRLRSLSKGKEYRDAMAVKFSKYAEFVVAEENSKRLGFAVFYANDYEEKRAYLSMIATAIDSTNKGVGTALLGYVCFVCREKGMKTLCLEVASDNSAKDFYFKNGFVVKEKKVESLILAKELL